MRTGGNLNPCRRDSSERLRARIPPYDVDLFKRAVTSEAGGWTVAGRSTDASRSVDRHASVAKRARRGHHAEWWRRGCATARARVDWASPRALGPFLAALVAARLAVDRRGAGGPVNGPVQRTAWSGILPARGQSYQGSESRATIRRCPRRLGEGPGSGSDGAAEGLREISTGSVGAPIGPPNISVNGIQRSRVASSEWKPAKD